MTQDRRRRLAAVWFADIVGYTDLSARDEDLALRVVRELQRIAKKHCQARGGRVVKLMGDAVLTVFDSVDGAVRAAIALRDEFLGSDEAKAGEVSLRVGLHSGEVADAPDGDVYGDAVNVASRIERVAEPGKVVISQVAYLTIQQRASMEAELLGEYDLKGLPEPLRLYSVRLEDEEETTPLRELLQEAIAPLQLLDVEGMGGMGEIYLARDPGLRRTLAVKVLKSELAADSQARARFQREATVIAGLSHPNVITIHSVGELKDETPYFVMDYIEGGSLADRLEQEGPLSVPESRRILGEVASALQAAHGKGIVHRDIKAANVLWDLESGRALVTDWGIAALDPTVELAPETRLTKTGVFIGSPQYMSPEQLAGDEVGPETDIYSLGLLAFELLTGHGPFPAETPREIMISHLREDAPDLAAVREDADPELESLIAQCLRKNPGDRPSAGSIARRLAPGSDSLLEWPPPGLGSLQGKFYSVSKWWGLSFLLLSIPLLVAIGFPHVGGASWLSSLNLLAVLALLAGALLFSSAISSWVKGLDLGFGWTTLAEVASDRRGDTGKLIAGIREYVSLSVTDRLTLRRARIARALSLSGAALVLPLSALLVLSLSDDTRLQPTGAAILLVAPAAALVFLYIGLGYPEWRATVGFRKAQRRRATPMSSTKALVDTWHQVLEPAGSGSGLGRGPTGYRWLARVLSQGLGVLGAAMALGLLLFSVFTSLVVAVFPVPPGQRFLRGVEQTGEVRAAAYLRLPVDSAVSPQRAGEVLLALDTFQVEEWWNSISPPVEIAGSRIVAGGGPFGSCPTPSQCQPHAISVDSLLPAAFGGLTAAERSYLQSWAQDPRVPLFQALARASGLDDGVFNLHHPGYPELPPNPSPQAIPFRTLEAVEDIWVGRLAATALHVADGRLENAEEVLREVLSVGLLLVEESTFGVGAQSGWLIARRGISHLRLFYSLTGRAAQVMRLEVPEGLPRTAREGPWEDLSSTWEDLVFDPEMIPSVRFYALRNLVVNETCGSYRGMVFGPRQELMRRIDGELRAELVKTPFQELNFEAILDWSSRMGPTALAEASGIGSEEADPGFGSKISQLLNLDKIAACILY